VHRSVALALLLKQRGFMDACDATLALSRCSGIWREVKGQLRLRRLRRCLRSGLSMLLCARLVVVVERWF